MDIWRGLSDVPDNLPGTVVTIGVFDGMHRGHRTLIGEATSAADDLGLPSVLLTFDPHPLAVVRPDRMPPLLGPVAQRARLAQGLGIHHMLALSFNADMASLSPAEFFEQVLVGTLRASVVVVGENFTFGYRAAGTTDTLVELGAQHGVTIRVVPLLKDDGEVICSTLIRGLLARGDVARANWALGREFSVQGEVVRGAGRGGRELGYPTANLYFPESVALPKDAVYAGWVSVLSEAPIHGDMDHGVRYPAAISVGNNPTFGDARRSVESYVIDREADLYGHTIKVEFIEMIRENEKFDSIGALLEAIRTDVDYTKELLEGR